MSALYLVRLPVGLAALARWAASRNYGWTTHRNLKGRECDADFDEGRALHHLLAETFGPGMLHPFRLLVAAPATRGHIYAYSRADEATLRDTAQSFALPEIAAVCPWTQLDAKEMPDEWRKGRRIGFDVRVKPTSRLMKPLPQLDGGSFGKGAEIDAFLIEALRSFPDPSSAEANMQQAGRSRESVYTRWLAQRLQGIATVEPGATMTRFLRRRASRSGFSPEGPDATLQGNLIVDDSQRFYVMLANGIGRHKAYGYGMVLLRPPRRA